MRIKKVKIKNFRGYGENKNSDDGFYIFDNLDCYNIVILTGLNGHGKTSFYEAVEWCLTGDIKRIQIVINKSNKNIRKKSRHLIYNNCNGINRNEAIVEITFNNNYKLIRKTNSNSLTDSSDDLVLYKNEQIYKAETAKDELLKELTKRKIDIKQVYNSISLGQETLANFMRGEQDTQRKQDLLNLFHLEDYNDIKEKSNKKNFKNLNESSYSKEIKEFEQLKQYVDNIFKSSGFKIEEYLISIKNYNEKLKDKYKDEIDYEISNDNITNNLGFVIYLKNKKSELLINTQNLKQYNENLIKVLHFKKYLKIKNEKELIEEIEKIDCKKLNKAINIRINKLEKYFKYKTDILNNKTKLIKEKNKLESIVINENFNIIDNDIINNIIILSKEFFYYNDNELKKLNNEYIKENYKLEKNAEILLKEYNDLNSLNSEYNDALFKMKSYLMNNKVDSCPICGNKEIPLEDNCGTFDHDNNYKIIKIIDETLCNNNNKLKIKLDNIKTNKNLQKKLQNDYKKNIIKEVIKIKENSIKKFQLKIEKMDKLINLAQVYLIKLKEEKKNFSNLKENYIKLKIKLENIYDKKDINEIKNVVKIKDDYINSKIIKKFNLYSKNEVQKNYQNIIESINIKDSCSNEYLFNCMKNNNKKLLDKKSLLKDINTFLEKIEISEDNINQIEKYNNYLKKKNKYIELEKIITNYKKDRQNIYDKIESESKKLLNEKLEQYKGLGNYIYKSIAPHPFYNEFNFADMYGGTEVTLKGYNDINLSHIFSNAQVNILALSIFLGIGLLDNKINLEQLFIDDPIQSMDDINVLAFIDLLRTILISKKVNKQLVISTHNREFATLLKIKLRNLTYKEFNFKYYGEEGPIIEERVNIVN